jgi:hypothetical protein
MNKENNMYKSQKVLICKSDCGYGDGIFHMEDIRHISNGNDLEIDTISLYNFPFCSSTTVSNLLSKARDCSLVIFPFHSSAMVQFIKILSQINIDDLFKGEFKVVVWTLDNHLFPEDDLIIQRMVDKLYVAHKNYDSHLDPRKTAYLPPAYYLTCIDNYIEDARYIFTENVDILCNFRYFKHHNQEDGRIKVAYEAYKIIKKDFPDLKIVCASILNPRDYINALRSSKIIMNISMYDDFNIRNFETIAFNKTLLTSWTSAHDLTKTKCNINFNKTFIFQRDCSDLSEKIQEALLNTSNSDREYSTSNSIFSENMLIHRYVDIINDIFGKNYEVSTNQNKIYHIKSDIIPFRTTEEYTLAELGERYAYLLLLNGKYKEAKNILEEVIDLKYPAK